MVEKLISNVNLEKSKSPRETKISSEIQVIYSDFYNIFADTMSRVSDLRDCINKNTELMGDSMDDEFVYNLFDCEEESEEICLVIEFLIEEHGYDVFSLITCLDKIISDYFADMGLPDLFKDVIELVEEIMLVDKIFDVEEVKFSFPQNDDVEMENGDLFDDIPLQLNYRNIKIDSRACKKLYNKCGFKLDSSSGKGGHVKFIHEDLGCVIIYSGSELYLDQIVNELIDVGVTIDIVAHGLKKCKYMR